MQTIAKYFIAFLLLLISQVFQTMPEKDKEIIRSTIKPVSTCNLSYSILPHSSLKSCMANLDQARVELETAGGSAGISPCET